MKLFTFVISIICFNLSFGQVNLDAKRDLMWSLGNGNAPSHKTILNFHTIPFSQIAPISPINTYLTNSCICDTNGRLLFYTNGMYVCDSLNQKMPHGDSLSFGDLYQWFENPYDWIGYPITQGALTLPVPGSNHLYYIFHEKLNWDSYGVNERVPGLLYSLVDMSLHNGLGDVIDKNRNTLLIRDTINYGMLTATRHADGRDWWILVPGINQAVYYKVLVSPYGLLVTSQQVPSPVAHNLEVGQAVFSPDGSKYVRAGADSYITPFKIEVYSFDRCDGTLSDYVDLTGTCDVNNVPSLAISPNSQYLYVSNCHDLYQFDLQASNIASSKQLIATYDNFVCTANNTYFWILELAPDGKIYVGANSSACLHVINNPDLPGIACDFHQHNVQLLSVNFTSLPNYPNFRLGPLSGTICDSLYNSINEIAPDATNLSIFPNPASDIIQIDISSNTKYKRMDIEIINMLSQKTEIVSLAPYQAVVTINIEYLSEGMYTCILKSDHKIVSSGKFLISR